MTSDIENNTVNSGNNDTNNTNNNNTNNNSNVRKRHLWTKEDQPQKRGRIRGASKYAFGGRRLNKVTARRLFELREFRMERMPPHKIVEEMQITTRQYQYLMVLLEEEDMHILELESPKRLASEIQLYKDTAGEIIVECLRQIRDPALDPEVKTEFMKILNDTSMAIIKVQVEGPRVLRDIQAPLGTYLQYGTGKPPVPLPGKEEEKQQQQPQKEQTIPPSNDDKENTDVDS